MAFGIKKMTMKKCGMPTNGPGKLCPDYILNDDYTGCENRCLIIANSLYKSLFLLYNSKNSG